MWLTPRNGSTAEGAKATGCGSRARRAPIHAAWRSANSRADLSELREGMVNKHVAGGGAHAQGESLRSRQALQGDAKHLPGVRNFDLRDGSGWRSAFKQAQHGGHASAGDALSR